MKLPVYIDLNFNQPSKINKLQNCNIDDYFLEIETKKTHLFISYENKPYNHFVQKKLYNTNVTILLIVFLNKKCNNFV